jgi:hypothetical protein
MARSVEIYSADGTRVDTFENVEDVIIHDGYVKIRYVEGKTQKIVETNLPFIYRDGEKEIKE